MVIAKEGARVLAVQLAVFAQISIRGAAIIIGEATVKFKLSAGVPAFEPAFICNLALIVDPPFGFNVTEPIGALAVTVEAVAWFSCSCSVVGVAKLSTESFQ